MLTPSHLLINDQFPNDMNEYIFYTTEGYTEGPNGEQVENCQLLGTAFGIDHNEAMDKLFDENPWIAQAGFTPYGVLWRRLAENSTQEP